MRRPRPHASSLLSATLAVFILIVISTAHAQSWTPVPALGSEFVYSVVEHQGALYAVTDSLVFTSTDGGDVWAECAIQPAITAPVTRLFAADPHLYLGTTNGELYRTADSGSTWEDYAAGLPGFAVVGLAVLGDSIYCGTDGDGVYVRRWSTSSAWTAYNTGLSVVGATSLGTSGTNLVAGIALSLHVRAQGGSAWTEVSVDSTGAQRLIYETATQGAYLFAGTNRGVYRSGLDAQSWHKTDIQAFPDEDVVALTVDGSRLYAGLNFSLQHWIWYSDNFGATWNVHAHEFAELLDLAVAHERLWAGRVDGLWYFDVATGVSEPPASRPEALGVLSSRPNPFNASTEIRFALTNPGHVEVRVHDILGRWVTTLHTGFLPPGDHRVRWDGRMASGRDAASGVYLCQVGVDGELATRKLLLLR